VRQEEKKDEKKKYERGEMERRLVVFAQTIMGYVRESWHVYGGIKANRKTKEGEGVVGGRNEQEIDRGWGRKEKGKI
jgi:hypothetical protein